MSNSRKFWYFYANVYLTTASPSGNVGLDSGAFLLTKDTAIKVGVPNLQTDLFTNVNKLCPSCETQSAQTWKLLRNVHLSKPVLNLCMSCVQAWTLLVHWSYCLDTPCTLELLLGHSLYTTQVLLGYSLYTFSITIWALLVHYRDTVSVLLAH